MRAPRSPPPMSSSPAAPPRSPWPASICRPPGPPRRAGIRSPRRIARRTPSTRQSPSSYTTPPRPAPRSATSGAPRSGPAPPGRLRPRTPRSLPGYPHPLVPPRARRGAWRSSRRSCSRSRTRRRCSPRCAERSSPAPRPRRSRSSVSPRSRPSTGSVRPGTRSRRCSMLRRTSPPCAAGDLKEARQRFAELLSSGQGNETTQLYLADITARDGDPDGAIAAYRRLYDSSVALAARSRAARLLLDRDKRAEALALLDDYAADHPEDELELTLGKARLLADHGEADTGLALLSAAPERRPPHPSIDYDRAWILDQSG